MTCLCGADLANGNPSSNNNKGNPDRKSNKYLRIVLVYIVPISVFLSAIKETPKNYVDCAANRIELLDPFEYLWVFIHSFIEANFKQASRASASVCVNVYLLASIMEYKQQIFA